MPATYWLIPEHDLLVSRLYGLLTEEDLLGQQRQLRSDRAWLGLPAPVAGTRPLER